MTEHTEDSFVPTGVEGLDELLQGGLRPGAVYIVDGEPGTGKTTIGLQFARAGIEAGERVLYFSFSETVAELREILSSHGFPEEGLDLRFLRLDDELGPETPQTMIEPGELFLPRATEIIRRAVEEVKPHRLVIDSLADLRLVSQDLWLFRTQLIRLREIFAAEGRVTLLLDSMTDYSQYLRTLASGILHLEQSSTEFGITTRRLTVVKMRARPHATGPHDFRIETGGLCVYPRLIPATEIAGPSEIDTKRLASGVGEIDALLGGGPERSSSMLLLGPAGVGKSLLAMQFAAAAMGRGESSRAYLFDERENTFFLRERGIGLDLETPMREGRFGIHRVDPGQMSPGEFASKVRGDVEREDSRVVILDSLTGYMHAMSDARHLQLHLHELLTYLARQGVLTILILGEHGPLGGTPQPGLDLSYLADTVLLLRYFEYGGETRRALSVYKKRAGDHERFIREFKIGAGGIHVGEPLRRFRGVLTGLPEYVGDQLPGTET